MGLVGVGGDRRGAGGGSSTSAAVMAACGGAPVREDDGAAMGGSARPGGVGALGGPAQGRVHAARGEQQHAGGGMARERARKLVERDGTREARESVHPLGLI